MQATQMGAEVRVRCYKKWIEGALQLVSAQRVVPRIIAKMINARTVTTTMMMIILQFPSGRRQSSLQLLCKPTDSPIIKARIARRIITMTIMIIFFLRALLLYMTAFFVSSLAAST